METNSYYSKKRATTAAKFTVLFRGIATPTAVVATVLLVRVLTEEQYGVYNLFQAMLPGVIAVLSFGLDNSVSRYIPEFVKDGEFRLANRIGHFAQLIRLFTSTVVMLLLVVFWESWSGFFNIAGYRFEFTIFAATLVFNLQLMLLSTLLASYLLHKYSAGARAAVAVLKFFGYAILWLLGSDLLDVLLLELAIYALVTLIMVAVELRRPEKTKGTKSKLGPELRRRILRYAAFYNFNDIGAFTLGYRVDNFFISAMISPVAVGAYSLATVLAKSSGEISPVAFFQTVIRPVFFSLDRIKQADEVTMHFQLLLKLAVIFSLPITAFLSCYHSSLVSVVFGSKFQSYSYLIGVVSCFAMVTRFGSVVSFVAQLAEKAGVILFSKIFILYNVVALLWLVPRIGVLGAAIATGTALIMKELFIWWHVRDLASLRGMARFFSMSLAYWLAFAAVSFFVRKISVAPLAEFCIGTLLFAAFGLIYLRIPLLSVREKQFIRNVAPDKMRPVLVKLAFI